MSSKCCIKKKKDFGKSLKLLTDEMPEEYSSDSSNYDRIRRWYKRTSTYLKEYLSYNNLCEDLTSKNAEIFLHQLLAIYFLAYENIYRINQTNERFTKDYPMFLTDCLKNHKLINKKGHFHKRTIHSKDMSSFFDYFLEIPDALIMEKYRMTDIQKEKISELTKKELFPESKFLYFIKIFFDEK